jgi:linoleoyl-CoA desaturase
MHSLSFQPAGAFARDVNTRARAAMAKVSRFGDAGQWLPVAGIAGTGLTGYGDLLAGGHAYWRSLALVATAAFCAFMLIVQVGHDASHGAISSRPSVNRIALFWTFALLGVDGAQWRDRHIRLHHQVVNLPGTGIDADSVNLFRLAPDKPWHWWMRLQPLYGPMLYTVGHISLAWFEDFRDLRIHRRNGRREFLGLNALLKFTAGKIVHATVFLILPWLALRPSLISLVLGYFVASSLIAICFVTLVVGTHLSSLAEFPTPDSEGRLPHDWATHQVITSVDWMPESKMAILLTGGANAHVAHHLFPGYHHRHMAELSRIIAKAAADHGLTIHVTTFTGMLLSQWRHLVAMSRRPGM